MENLAAELDQLHIDHTQAFSRIAGVLAQNGESGVLIWLSRRNAETYATDIIEHFGLTPGRVANIVKRLETRGDIRRLQDREDLRRVRIYLTDQGTARAGTLFEEMHEAHARLLRELGESQAREMLLLLRRYLGASEESRTAS